jgi:hypothetical protein
VGQVLETSWVESSIRSFRPHSTFGFDFARPPPDWAGRIPLPRRFLNRLFHPPSLQQQHWLVRGLASDGTTWPAKACFHME